MRSDGSRARILRNRHALLLASLLVACPTPERAVRVTVLVRTSVDAVCLTAREESPAPSVVFATAYPAATLPSPATLTFVAGPGFDGPAEITARGIAAGSFVGGATVTTSLTAAGTTEATLPVERCRARGAAGFGTRPGGTFATLVTPPHAIATDYDADGRDELLAVAADGSLAVLDAESVDRGSHRESELRATDGVLVRAGDLDVDCRADLVVTAAAGALVISSEDGASPPPVGSAPRDVAIGRLARTAPARLVVGGGSGLALVAPPGGTGTTTMLSTHPTDHVASWDADGDGGTEVVATGAMGLLAYATSAGAESDVTSTLPMGFPMLHGPLGVGDLDDDGDVDLVVAEMDTLHVATRAASTFLDASGAPPTALDADVTRLEIADVDGDCADDVVAMSSAGTVTVLSLSPAGGLDVVGTMSGALDFTVGDFDGDGAREIALLGTGGRVTLWQP